MTLLHYGLHGGTSTFQAILGIIVGVVGIIFFGIATRGFKSPHKQKENKRS
jgi:hypothetical protein